MLVIVHPRARQESRISEGGVTMQKRTDGRHEENSWIARNHSEIKI
jgi:hypothetical protein